MILLSLVLSFSVGSAFAHTVDSVGEYRLEIGWMNEPVVSGETNGIELFVSPMEPDLPLEEQVFKDGITDLEDSLKMELVYKGEKITLPLQADHNIPGKYYAFVDPTTSGYYQANILGNIKDTQVSLSMHPPKVDDRTYIEFPEPSPTEKILEEHDIIKEEHDKLSQDINKIKETLNRIENNPQFDFSYIAIALGIAGIAIGSIAFSRRNSK